MLSWLKEHWYIVCQPELRKALRHAHKARRVAAASRLFNFMNMVRYAFTYFRVAISGRHVRLWELADDYVPAEPKPSDVEHFDSAAKRFWAQLPFDEATNLPDSRTLLKPRWELAGQASPGAPRKAPKTGGPSTQPENAKMKCPFCKQLGHVQAGCGKWLKTPDGEDFVKRTREARGGLQRKEWLKANPGKSAKDIPKVPLFK